MKLALIVLLDRYADWEVGFLAPLFHMASDDPQWESWSAKIVSLDKEPIQSMGKLTVLPDERMEDAPKDFQGLVLIGGLSWRTEEAVGVLPLLDHARQNNIPIAAICDAANFLGWHGYLNDVRHTGNAGGEMATFAGSRYTNQANFVEAERVISDGNIVTADGASAILFTAEVLKTFGVFPEAEVDEWLTVQNMGEKAYYE